MVHAGSGTGDLISVPDDPAASRSGTRPCHPAGVPCHPLTAGFGAKYFFGRLSLQLLRGLF